MTNHRPQASGSAVVLAVTRPFVLACLWLLMSFIRSLVFIARLTIREWHLRRANRPPSVRRARKTGRTPEELELHYTVSWLVWELSALVPPEEFWAAVQAQQGDPQWHRPAAIAAEYAASMRRSVDSPSAAIWSTEFAALAIKQRALTEPRVA